MDSIGKAEGRLAGVAGLASLAAGITSIILGQTVASAYLTDSDQCLQSFEKELVSITNLHHQKMYHLLKLKKLTQENAGFDSVRDSWIYDL